MLVDKDVDKEMGDKKAGGGHDRRWWNIHTKISTSLPLEQKCHQSVIIRKQVVCCSCCSIEVCDESNIQRCHRSAINGEQEAALFPQMSS